jgi:hypothetical protein
VVSDILAHPSQDAAQLRTSAGRLKELVRAVRALCPAER